MGRVICSLSHNYFISSSKTSQHSVTNKSTKFSLEHHRELRDFTSTLKILRAKQPVMIQTHHLISSSCFRHLCHAQPQSILVCACDCEYSDHLICITYKYSLLTYDFCSSGWVINYCTRTHPHRDKSRCVEINKCTVCMQMLTDALMHIFVSHNSTNLI